jgi:hypothetical protein
VWDGWESPRSPDNLELEVHFENGATIQMFASILELAELYNAVVDQQRVDMLIGTGNEVKINKDNGGVVFEVDEYSEETEYEALKERLQDCLREVFTELNAVSGTDERQHIIQEYSELKEVYEIIMG